MSSYIGLIEIWDILSYKNEKYFTKNKGELIFRQPQQIIKREK